MHTNLCGAVLESQCQGNDIDFEHANFGDRFCESGRTRYNVGAVTVVAKIEPSYRIARFSNHVGFCVS